MSKLSYLPIPLVALIALTGFSWSNISRKQVAPGVILTQEIQQNPPLVVNTLIIDPQSPGVSVSAAIANDSLTKSTGDIRKGRENVSDLAQRTGAIAAVNGDYFPYTGDPLGVGVANGELYSEPYKATGVIARAAFGILPSGLTIIGIPTLSATISTNDGFSIPLTGINRLTNTTDPDDAVLVTPRFGPFCGARKGDIEVVLESVNLPITLGKTISGTVHGIATEVIAPERVPLNGAVLVFPANATKLSDIQSHFVAGRQVEINCNLAESGEPQNQLWDTCTNIIGGGPILVKDGAAYNDALAEGFPPTFTDTPHSRTAIGSTKDGKIIIVTVDAGFAISGGITLGDLTNLMISKGAINAINLDGGGSTTMVVSGATIGYPSGIGSERPVADMVAVRAANEPSYIANNLQIVFPNQQLAVGQSYPLSVRVGRMMISGAQQQLIWNGPVGNIGFVTQDGYLHVYQSGHGAILASYNGVKIKCEIDVPPPVLPNQSPVVAPIISPIVEK